MLLTSSDGHAIKEVTLFYSVVSCIFLPIFSSVLYFTDFYLYFGKTIFFPVLGFLLFLEFVKWWFYFLIYEKDFKTIPNTKRSSSNVLLFKKFDFKEYVKTSLTVLAGCVVYFVVAILYGASITENHEGTLMFSSLMSVLTFFPPSLHAGRNFLKSILFRQKPSNMFHSLLYKNFQMTLIGAWLGAFVIPLDWDRPWQVWPIPCSYGALLGYTLSHYIILVKYFVFGSYSVFFKKKK